MKGRKRRMGVYASGGEIVGHVHRKSSGESEDEEYK